MECHPTFRPKTTFLDGTCRQDNWQEVILKNTALLCPLPPLHGWPILGCQPTNCSQDCILKRFLCSLNIFRYVSISEMKRALFDCPCQKKVVRGLIKICPGQNRSQTVDNNQGGSLPHKYNLKSQPSTGGDVYMKDCRRLQNKEVRKDTASKNIWMMLEVEGGGDD